MNNPGWLKGAAGAPRLDGTTPLAPGVQVTVGVEHAASSAVGAFVIGLAPVELPFFGGTLVPSPQILVPLTADPAGTASFQATWPPGLAVGAGVHVQAWMLDASGPQGFAASNALLGTQL